jgi:hypothetical protein
MNKVPTRKYTPNKYTGRSLMYHGGKKKMMGGGMGQSPMEMEMDRKMKMQMGGPSRSRLTYGHGGKAMKSDIYAMETACNKMAGYNKSLPKGR